MLSNRTYLLVLYVMCTERTRIIVYGQVGGTLAWNKVPRYICYVISNVYSNKIVNYKVPVNLTAGEEKLF
jgi:hypothetical protein